jgi:YVTN family beta-propeller protein
MAIKSGGGRYLLALRSWAAVLTLVLVAHDAGAQYLIGTVPVGNTPVGVAVNTTTNRVYVANLEGSSVSVIDGATNGVSATVSVGYKPRSVAANAGTNRIYVTHYFLRTVSVIDGASNAVIATVAVTGNPTGVDVNPATKRVYVASIADNSQGGTFAGVSVIDGTTNTVVGAVPVGSQSPSGSGPVSVGVNPVTNRIYVGGSNPSAVTVIDGATNTAIASIGLGSVDGIGVNPSTDRVYVANPGGNAVTVIDGASNAILGAVAVGSNPSDVDVDANTNRIYVANGSARTLSVLSGATNTVVATVSLSAGSGDVGGAGGMGLNAATKRIYVSHQQANVVSVMEDGPDLLVAGKIAFTSARDGNGEIYTMDSDGTAQTRVTLNTADDGTPSWSPDGARIGFKRGSGGSEDVYSVYPDGSGLTSLTSGGAVDMIPRWSPDGAKLSFMSQRNGNEELYLMNADGSSVVGLTNTGASEWDSHWSPDSAWIVFDSNRDGNWNVYVMNPDGTGQTRLTDNAADDLIPTWSPDGTKIAFESNRDGNFEIYVMNANGTGQTRLTSNSVPDGSAWWSPDGTRISFQSYRDGNWEIYTMNADGTAQTRLTNNGATDSSPSWAEFRRVGSTSLGVPVSRTMVVENEGGALLNVASITSSDAQFTASPAAFSVPAGASQSVAVTFTPTSAGTKYSTLTITSNDPNSPMVRLVVNGTGMPGADLEVAGQIALWSSRDGNHEVYKMEADGTQQARLTSLAANDYYPAWSPDATRIVFASERHGNPEVYTMDAEGTGVTRLTNSPGLDGHPAWSPDGAKIAFYSDRDGNREVYVMNADGTGQVRLTNDPAMDQWPMWSPDGSRIAFSSWRDGAAEVYVMSVDGSGQTRLTNNPTADLYPAWSPDGSHIAFVVGEYASSELYVMNADGTGRTRITNDSVYQASPFWSPDGTRIGFEGDLEGGLDYEEVEIYRMNADGGGLARLTSNAASDYMPRWAHFQRIGGPAVGDSVARALKVRNSGTTPLVVSNVTSSNTQFRITPSMFAVAPGDSQQVMVRFVPTAIGTQYSTLTFLSNDPDTVRLVVNGTGRGVAVSIPDTTARYLQALSVPVRVSDTSGEGVVSAEVFATYDGDLLLSPVVEAGSLLTPDWTVESHVIQGVGTAMDTLRIAMATDDDTLSGSGSLANLRFRVADVRHPASTPVRLAHVLVNAGSPGNVRDDGSVKLIGFDGIITRDKAQVIPREAIAVQVVDADEDQDTTVVDDLDVTVTVRDSVEAVLETEVLKLWETGPHSGVFTEDMETVFSLVPQQGDFRLQVRAGLHIEFLHDDLLDGSGNGPLNRRVTTQVLGGQDGQLRVTVVSQPGDTVRVRVTDGDLNTDPGQQDSIGVSVINWRIGESEVVRLRELGASSSVFFGQLPTMLGSVAGPNNDGVMTIRKADTLVVAYGDSLTGLGGTANVWQVNRVVNPFGDADGNGQVQAYDASRVLYHRLSPYLVGLDSLTANVDLGAPFGPITAYDAALILQRRVGRIWRFPVQEDESVNHPQPETDLSVPKPAGAERLITLQPGEGYVSVWAEERAGIISGELEVEGITGKAVMAPELGEFLVASRVADGGVRVVFAGTEGVQGAGELVRLYGVGPQQVQLTRAWLNDGQIGVRLGEGPVAAVLPLAFALYAPQPNPFNPETTIRFDLPTAGAVRLEVYDVVGQRVRVLVSGDLRAGLHQVTWDGRTESGMPVSSGVYLCRLQAGGSTQMQRMVLLK